MLVGRPNVGKSSIFNKLLGETNARASKIAGTTLDLNMRKISHYNADFLISDSGGFNISPSNELEKKIRDKVFIYAKSAKVMLLTVDFKAGLIPEDKEIFRKFLKINSSIVLVINKVDSLRDNDDAYALFSSLGIKTMIAVSAENSSGIDDLLDIIAKELKIEIVVPKKEPNKTELKEGQTTDIRENDVKIAIIGKPNSGKSTYINTILKEDLLFVDDKPGTTRDSTDTYLKYKGYSLTLIDTAGIRKKSRLDINSEEYQRQSLNQIRRADTVVIFIDIITGITHEDLALLKLVVLEKKPYIVAFTKWDKKTDDIGISELRKDIIHDLKEFGDSPWMYISSVGEKNLYKLLDKSIELYNSKYIRIKTKDINKFLLDLKADDKKGRFFKFLAYGVQKDEANIPTFIFFTGNRRKIFRMEDIKRLRAEVKDYFSIKSSVEVLMEYKKDKKDD